MKKKIKRWTLPLFFMGLGLFLTAAIVFGADKNTDQYLNRLSVPKIEGTIEETFTEKQDITIGDTNGYEKKITVKNEGNTGMFVRVMVLPEIKKDGALLPATIGSEVLATLGTDWLDGGDGYYYYKKRVDKGATTTPVFSTNTTLASTLGNEYKGATLTMEVKSETVSSASSDYRNVWWGLKTSDAPSDTRKAVDDALQTAGVISSGQ